MLDEERPMFTEGEIASAEKQIVDQSKRIEFYITEFTVEILALKMKNGDFEVPNYQREDTWDARFGQGRKYDTQGNNQKQPIFCVDLFCGVGGLTHGLIKGGVRVIAGIDIDPQCSFPYEYNNHSRFIEKDVSQLIIGNELIDIFGDSKLRLLAGCAPCQPFSTYSRKGRQVRNDTKWGLVSEFSRLIKETQPELVTMENDRMTVRQAIAHLPALAAGCCDPNDSLHTASSLSELNLYRIRASKPGGTWRDWDESLLAQCHRKQSGQTYPSVYGRMEWDAPSPTITTQCFGYGNGRFGHPEQDRAISLREAAILQTFPDDYCFLAPGEKTNFAKLGRLIGNAVPVRIGELVAQSLVSHLQNAG